MVFASTDNRSMLYLPTIISFVYLNQIMLGKMSLALFNVTHDIFKIADIAFRIEWGCGKLKRYTTFSADFLRKDCERRTHGNSHLANGFFRQEVMTMITTNGAYMTRNCDVQIVQIDVDLSA